jgi:peptide methionine sulfoxide reductase msrA/msrB
MGTQYRSGIYYRGDLQKVAVDSSKAREQEKYEVKVVTEVLPEATW